MAGYMIAEIELKDPEVYAEYTKRALPAVKKYEGRVRVFCDNCEVLEGDMPIHRLVVVEFASVEQAKEFYHSSEYQEAIPFRHKGARTSFVTIVEGR